MNTKTIRSELHKLTALVEGWEDRAPGPIPALERDLVLEKLRSLYDAVQFAAAEPAGGPDAEPAAADEAADTVAIDLGAVLSLDSLSPEQSEAAPEVALVAGPEPAQPAPVAEPEPDAAQPALVAEPEPDMAQPALVAELEPDAAQPAPVAEPEPDAAQPALVAELEPDASQPHPEAVSEPAAAPIPGPEAEFPAVPAAEPAAAPAPAPDAKPRYIAPTLFGLEEETVRHRHKQRVIMSLYDTPVERPAPAEKPARPEPTRQEATPPVPAASQASAATGSGAAPESAAPEHSASAVSRLADAQHSQAAQQPAETQQSVRPDTPIVSDSATAPKADAESNFAAEPDAAATANAAAEPAEQPIFEKIVAEPETPESPEPFEILEITELETPATLEPHLSAQSAAPEFVPSSEVRAETLDPEEEPEAEAAEIPFAPTPSTSPSPSAVDPAPAGAVLGEVINHDVQTLGDVIARPRDMASELRRSEPVTDLRRAIGINDKFLLIRDLFGGDGAAYDEAIATLNGFDDLDDCMIHIAENYAWNPNSDGAKLIMELLERKFA